MGETRVHIDKVKSVQGVVYEDFSLIFDSRGGVVGCEVFAVYELR